MKTRANKFEVDLGELKIDEARKKIIATKIQKLVLEEMADLGVANDFTARILVPGRFPDIDLWGIWIDPNRRDDVFEPFLR